MTKKSLLVISGIVSVLLIVLNYIGTFKFCGGVNYGSCMDTTYNVLLILFPIIPLFILSLITFKMPEAIFQAWWKFARIFVPISMLAILVAPSNSSNWMLPIEKGSVAFFASIIFLVASLIQLAFLSFKSKK